MKEAVQEQIRLFAFLRVSLELLMKSPSNHKAKQRRSSIIGKISVHRVVAGVAVGLAMLLLFTTILFAILFFGTRREQVPIWPSSKNSLNGRYATAAVASDHVRCSEIGRNVLIEGGNAVDAAIAVLICLGVVHPMSSGLGGGHFMTIYNA
uniref:Gamma-glutamyltransferase n=1 Tax=Ascaris lumbricoides TaxID=6252 RepID=A0A0M3IMJ1_ASCLU